ncbi:MAG: carboxymuconolactone decarboxylase family protein [Rhodospirillales bacterium]|jgi:AhpD family alkylhydroperoxidase|nr:carboxymuconolactone decarboxylase family protein [Rhodospirillales bacterium]
MTISAKQILQERRHAGDRLKLEAPDISDGFRGMLERFYTPGALDAREKELAAVACSVALASASSLAVHLANAMEAGATRQQAIEAAAIGVEFGGGLAFTLVRDHLLAFLDEIEAAG